MNRQFQCIIFVNALFVNMVVVEALHFSDGVTRASFKTVVNIEWASIRDHP